MDVFHLLISSLPAPLCVAPLQSSPSPSDPLHPLMSPIPLILQQHPCCSPPPPLLPLLPQAI